MFTCRFKFKRFKNKLFCVEITVLTIPLRNGWVNRKCHLYIVTCTRSKAFKRINNVFNRINEANTQIVIFGNTLFVCKLIVGLKYVCQYPGIKNVYNENQCSRKKLRKYLFNLFRFFENCAGSEWKKILDFKSFTNKTYLHFYAKVNLKVIYLY